MTRPYRPGNDTRMVYDPIDLMVLMILHYSASSLYRQDERVLNLVSLTESREQDERVLTQYLFHNRSRRCESRDDLK